MSLPDSPDTSFPEVHWDEIRRRVESEGAKSVVEFIQQQENPGARLNLFAFTQQALGSREWRGKNLDALMQVADAGIQTALAIAGESENKNKAAAILDFGNVLSYNLAADLAECWPGDDLARETRHFERGLAAADACLQWRRELGKGDYPFAVAYWARGMHLISLGRYRAAVGALAESVHHAKKLAAEKGVSTEVEPDGDFLVVLNSGYWGLARALVGETDGRALYEHACLAFEESCGEHAEDAQFGLEQLRHVGLKFL
jgi:tetratricopeptide (TPR) repeat protein